MLGVLLAALLIVNILLLKEVQANNFNAEPKTLETGLASIYDTAIAYKPHNGYIEPPPEPPKPKSVVIGTCNCVLYAKSITGFSQSVGEAKNWPTNSPVPVPGGVVVSTYSKPGTSTGHVDVIDGIDWVNRRMWVNGENFSSCKAQGRWMSLDDPKIIGYWTDI